MHPIPQATYVTERSFRPSSDRRCKTSRLKREVAKGTSRCWRAGCGSRNAKTLKIPSGATSSADQNMRHLKEVEGFSLSGSCSASVPHHPRERSFLRVQTWGYIRMSFRFKASAARPALSFSQRSPPLAWPRRRSVCRFGRPKKAAGRPFFW